MTRYPDEYTAYTRLLRQATGWGLSAKKSSMLSHMEEFIEAGDTDVDIIGFSRAAVTAIAFAEAVEKLRDEKVPPFCAIERIRFLGLYDPVPGPFMADRPEIPKLVGSAAIAYSLDEKRDQFRPSIYNGPSVTSRRFRGGHSDIGGGYKERGLANITIEWMTDQGIRAGAPFTMPSTSMSAALVRHQEINYDLYLYSDRSILTSAPGMPLHGSVSRLVQAPVAQVEQSPRLGVDVTPYPYFLDQAAPVSSAYRLGDRGF